MPQAISIPDPLDLVIFDCDGVLIDSEIIANRVYPEVFASFGCPLTAADMDRFVGMTDVATFAAIEREWGRPLPPDHAARLAMAMKAAYRTELRAIPGVAEVLDGLVPRRCVASSSAPEKLRFGLECVGLYERFAPHVFSASSVAHGKPAPDLFLYAAQQMAAPPDACLVIEDSVAGVQAARAGGMTVLGFVGGGHCRPGHGERLRAAGAAATFRDMGELPAILAGR